MPIQMLTEKLYSLVLSGKISASDAFKIIDNKLSQDQLKQFNKTMRGKK